jgi:hypothetical protein
MNDPIYRAPNDSLYKKTKTDEVFKLHRNIFRQYIWKRINDTLPPNCVETTLRGEGFKMVRESIMKETPTPIVPDDVMDYIVDSRGGFGMAKNTDNVFVSSTHDAVRHFANWVPENAQQRRFKIMVTNLETRAMEEEDDFAFTEGCANGYFKNPI